MSFDDIVVDLKLKQAHIEGLHQKIMEKKNESEARIKAYSEPLQKEIDILDKDLQEKIAYYKAETKKHFGICDGENMNVVETLVAFKRVMSL